MPVLTIMRHAKAVDRMDAEDDFERGLSERGRHDCDRAAAAVARAGLSADLALVSPARRTRETYQRVASALGEPPVRDPMALYHASKEMLERAVMEALENGAEAIVLVGHNPGVGALAHGLAASAGAEARLPRGWPAAAAAAFELDLSPAGLTAREHLFLFNPKSA